MNVAEYEAMDGLSLAALVRSGEIEPIELLDLAIGQVERLNPSLNAVVMELYDFGRQAITAGLPDGPFQGVPFLLKDLNGPLGGVRTTRGSQFFTDVVMPEDGELVKRLRRAGFVIFGKTNTCELGLSVTCEPQLYGPTHNPWDRTRTPGGSSGGAAAAVAARMTPIAHAADGFGSIRVPAACCNLVGLKPTRARNSLAPYLGEAVAGLVAEHVVTRTVRDCAAVLDAVSGSALGDPYAAPTPARPFFEEVGADPGKLQIAFTAEPRNGGSIDPECLRVLHETARLCADLGHRVEEADPDFDGALAWRTFETLVSVATLANLQSHPLKKRMPESGEVENVTLATARRGETVTGLDYLRATQTAHMLGRKMAAFHSRFDVLLTPALAEPPVKLGWLDMMLDDMDEYWRRIEQFTPFTVWFNVTGQPAIVIPAGRTPAGLPLAIQAVARFGDEATLFRLAAQLEIARPWIGDKPALNLAAAPGAHQIGG